MPLIDADDTATASAYVAKDGFNGLQVDPELLQSGRDSAAKIMQAPRLDVRQRVDPSLPVSPSSDGAPTIIDADDVISIGALRDFLEQRSSGGGEGNGVRLAVLGALAVELDRVASDLAPFEPRDLFL